jgi:hypothetical protein
MSYASHVRPLETTQFFSEALSEAMHNKGVIPGDTVMWFSVFTQMPCPADEAHVLKSV